MKKTTQLRLERAETRLAFLTRKQTHIHARMDLIEENIAELKIYLDTLTKLCEKRLFEDDQ